MKHEKVIVEVCKPNGELPKYALYSKDGFATLIQDLKKFKKEGRRFICGEDTYHCGFEEGDLEFIFRDDVYFDKILAILIVKKH